MIRFSHEPLALFLVCHVPYVSFGSSSISMVHQRWCLCPPSLAHLPDVPAATSVRQPSRARGKVAYGFSSIFGFVTNKDLQTEYKNNSINNIIIMILFLVVFTTVYITSYHIVKIYVSMLFTVANPTKFSPQGSLSVRSIEPWRTLGNIISCTCGVFSEKWVKADRSQSLCWHWWCDSSDPDVAVQTCFLRPRVLGFEVSRKMRSLCGTVYDGTNPLFFLFFFFIN